MRVAIFSNVHAGLSAVEGTLGDIEVADVEAAARAIEAAGLPSEFADQLREARGHR
jgi:hypothetical protein